MKNYRNGKKKKKEGISVGKKPVFEGALDKKNKPLMNSIRLQSKFANGGLYETL